MKVFWFGPLEGYEFVVPAVGTGSTYPRIAGKRQGAAWRPVPVELMVEEDGQPLLAADAPYLASALLVLKDSALPRVSGLLAPYAEFLPLSCPQVPLTAVNVVEVVDALDEETSSITRLRSGKLMSIERFGFRSDRLPDRSLFKIPQSLRQGVHCTEPVALELQDRLTGLNPRLVWQDD